MKSRHIFVRYGYILTVNRDVTSRTLKFSLENNTLTEVARQVSLFHVMKN